MVDPFEEIVNTLSDEYLRAAEMKVLELYQTLPVPNMPPLSRGILHTDASVVSEAEAFPTSYIAWLFGAPPLLDGQEHLIETVSKRLCTASPRLAFAWSHRSRSVSTLDVSFDPFLLEIVGLSAGNYPAWHFRNLEDSDFFHSESLKELVAYLATSPSSVGDAVMDRFPRCTPLGFRILSEGLSMTVASQNEAD